MQLIYAFIVHKMKFRLYTYVFRTGHLSELHKGTNKCRSKLLTKFTCIFLGVRVAPGHSPFVVRPVESSEVQMWEPSFQGN